MMLSSHCAHAALAVRLVQMLGPADLHGDHETTNYTLQPQHYSHCSSHTSLHHSRCKPRTAYTPHQAHHLTVLPVGLTPFLVKLLSEDELTTKQALHLIDLQLREQVSFQDVHELYMLDYITSIPSPHLRTCQLLVGLNTAARLVQILKGTAGSGKLSCA